MTTSKFARGKTNKHKSTEKSHTMAKVALAVPGSHGKPLNTTSPTGPRKAVGRPK